MNKLFFYISAPISFLIGLLGAVFQIPKIITMYKRGHDLQNIVDEVLNGIYKNLSWYTDMPEFGQALVAIFLYSVVYRIFS